MLDKPYITITTPKEGTGRLLHLDYYILEDQAALSDSISIVTYGVAIRMRQGSRVEHIIIPSLFTYRGGAVKFIECLARNSVTPTTLMDIVEDNFAIPVTREASKKAS